MRKRKIAPRPIPKKFQKKFQNEPKNRLVPQSRFPFLDRVKQAREKNLGRFKISKYLGKNQVKIK
jgi:hypothetical protein